MSHTPTQALLGADGCRAGWVYVLEDARGVRADAVWPGAYAAAVGALPRTIPDVRGRPYAPDDLIDAFAALWSARRMAAGTSVSFPDGPAPLDAAGIPATIRG